MQFAKTSFRRPLATLDRIPLIAMLTLAYVTAHGVELEAGLSGHDQPVIGAITINNGGIFDLEDPKEDGLFYRLANKLHWTTRPHVIEQQLLFEAGEAFSAQAVNESERILRDNRYIQDAEIEPVPRSNGVIDLNVNTSDTWTLMPKASFSHSGGASSTGVGLKEANLLGTGTRIEFFYKTDVDRDSKAFNILDRHIGSSWYGINLTAADNSDGHQYFVEVGKPFYSLDSRSAHSFSALDVDRTDSLYDRGEIAAQFQHKMTNYELNAGWSQGLRNGWTRRYTAGLGYDEHRFTESADPAGWMTLIPDNRKFVFPFVSIEIVQDKYEEAVNFDQIARTEDRFIGSSFKARVGAAQRTFGSSTDAWLLNAAARTSISKSQTSSLFLASEVGARVEQGEVANLVLGMDARYYKRLSDKRLFFARLSGSYGHNLDLDQPMYLGGDNGLRGYPLRYQAGDKRALLTIEQRFFTDWYPLRLFRVGAAVFFDAGRTWGDGPLGATNGKLLKDFGAGLRLGNARSSTGRIIHIDVAYPLDGNSDISNVQFIVETKQSF